MSQAIALQHTLPTGSLDTYIGAAFQLPILSEQEERELAVRLRDNNDLEAARTLVLSHVRFVVRVARQYAGYGLAHNDLVQEGTVGLMKAVRRFDPDMGVRLVSFAVHWIKAEIHEYILRNWRIVKIATTKAQRKLFFNLRSAKHRLGWFSREEVEAVAEDLGVKPEAVIEMEARLANQDVAFDMDDSEDDDARTFAPVNYLPDLRMDPARQLEQSDSEEDARDKLYAALSKLDERSREIVAQRWLGEESKSTLQELAGRYGVSAERIRQIEKAAFKKLRQQLAA
jgi:RNA polymerase sigma-32 factor